MTTPQEILEAAYGRSTQNQPKQLSTEATELKKLVDRAMDGIYGVAARLNRTFFGKQATVSFSAPGWARPTDALSVFHLEVAGVEVVTVPYNDRTAEAQLPAVYRIGQIYRSAGNPNDPTSGNMEMFYSKMPAKPTLVTDALDSLWNTAFDDFLVLEVAIYLAIKDDRTNDFQTLSVQRDREANRFASFLEIEHVGERRRFSHAERVNSPTAFPIGSLLAGGNANLGDEG